MTKEERQATVSAYFKDLQERICAALTQTDGKGAFQEDNWKREAGGGGRTRIMSNGAIFEKGGVNFSEVAGEMSPEFAAQVPGEGRAFTATGISLVLHPANPFVPTVHANFRYLTKGAKEWFGGGADLTPYYPYREDVIHFHRTWKTVCERHAHVVEYQRLKQWCDEYFFLPHRNEPRGVGGIFFDYLEENWEATFAFVREAADAFLGAYLPIVERRGHISYTDRQKSFQEFRRGRYAEFNLLYDRGTIFGLKTGGRVESILMSLPPLVRWIYDYQVEPGSPEARLVEEYLKPKNWAEEKV